MKYGCRFGLAGSDELSLSITWTDTCPGDWGASFSLEASSSSSEASSSSSSLISDIFPLKTYSSTFDLDALGTKLPIDLNSIDSRSLCARGDGEGCASSS